MKTTLMEKEIKQIFIEALARKQDKNFPVDVRVRCAETAALCLSRANKEGWDTKTWWPKNKVQS